MNVLSNNLAKLIKKRRLEIGLTQPKLNLLLGYKSGNGQTISNIERGKCQLPIKLLDKLSLVLMISREAIIEAAVEDYKESLRKELSK